MKTYLGILAFFIISTSTIIAQNIDKKTSVVNFNVDNLGINNVKGTFKHMSGTFNFDPNELGNSSFDICIKASTINTDNNKRDTHLKTEDFFDVEKYPNICFTSTSISKTKDGYVTKGKLTIHGVTKAVEIPFQFNDKTFTGHFEVNRLDYNVGEGTGTFIVTDTIKIDITCVVQ